MSHGAGGGVVVIFGGRSEIGVAIAERLAATASVVVLAVRPGSDAAGAARLVRDAGAPRVEVVDFDADDTARHRAVVADIEERCGAIATAVLAFGILGDQDRAEHDEAEVVRVLHTDFVAQASLLTVLADVMRGRASTGSAGKGAIVAFSSVAGVRVRRANYVYGSAKAGLDGFASGLADVLHGSGVDLVIARPGFVIGRMTTGMDPAPFSSTPDQVADLVVGRLQRAGSRPAPPVLWIPWQLRALFSVAPFVPRPVWRRMPR